MQMRTSLETGFIGVGSKQAIAGKEESRVDGVIKGFSPLYCFHHPPTKYILSIKVGLILFLQLSSV